MNIFYLVHKINKKKLKKNRQMMRQSSGNINCKRNEYLALISCWQATYNYSLIF